MVDCEIMAASELKHNFRSVNTALPASLDELLTGGSMTLNIPPKTDLYASPSIGIHFSAPIVYIQIPTKQFGSAKITASIPFTANLRGPVENPNLQYDQAGMVFVLPNRLHPNPTKGDPGTGEVDSAHPHPKWVKAGVECWDGGHGSVVSRDRWSDWSLFRVKKAEPREEGGVPYLQADYEFERSGYSLLISKITKDEHVEGRVRKDPVRKVPWFFQDDEADETLWVGVYGARPDPSGKAEGKELQAVFENLVLNDRDGNSLV